MSPSDEPPKLPQPLTGRRSASMEASRKLEQAAVEKLSPRQRLLKALALGTRGKRLAGRAAQMGSAGKDADEP
jgi:hypothetical protein